MASCRSTQDTILTDEELLDTVCSANFCDQLYNLRVPVSSITTNNQETALDAFGNGQQNAGDEGFAVVLLLKDDDLLSQARSVIVVSFGGLETECGAESGKTLTFQASGR